ncbi:MAG TPA: Uma2 family endonuclease [Acetobacteraceae bacterium]
MSVVLRRPAMTRDQFFAWAEADGGRWEFDGFEPVAMTGGNLSHSQIGVNLITALRTRLRGAACRPLGPDAGLATIGDTVRYPDALVTCTRVSGEARVVPGVVVVFEVLSPTSGRVDRIVKLREYRAVPTIRRYVILEYASAELTVFTRNAADADWVAIPLTDKDTLHMPEIGIEIPVAEFYEDVEFPSAADAAERVG